MTRHFHPGLNDPCEVEETPRHWSEWLVLLAEAGVAVLVIWALLTATFVALAGGMQ